MSAATSRRKPTQLHIHNPQKHIGKAEMQARAEAEVSMGKVKFTPPPLVKSNEIAIKKWREITRIYKDSGLEFVSSSDNGVLGRYCMAYSEYLDLVEKRRALSGFQLSPSDENELNSLTKSEYHHARAKKLWNIMDYMVSLNGLISLDRSINAKLKTLLDLEDRIFLNPAAKVRTLPIKPKQKPKDKMGEMGFDV